MTRHFFETAYLRIVLVLIVGAIICDPGINRADQPSTNAAPASVQGTTSAAAVLHQASQDFSDDKADVAMREVSLALQLDPKNLSAYELRSSIFVSQKLWDRAEDDIRAADKIRPDVAYKYKLGEIRYLARDYGNARPRFAALVSDPRLGDLATYKVMLCDLIGGHEAIAARDLAEIDRGERKPSYYFGHAAWELVHNRRSDAQKWFAQAQQIYDSTTLDIYIASLLESQRVRLPTASFTTRDGRKFEHARVSLENDGLRAAVKNTWVTLLT